MENLFINLLNRRGQILWTTSRPKIIEMQMSDLIQEQNRQLFEAELSKCIVHGKPTSFIAVWQCSPTPVTVQTHLYPIEPSRDLSVAAVSVQRLVTDNYHEFSESDLSMLRLLAEDHQIKDVANSVSRSESAIDTRIRSLKTKMGRTTLHGLVAGAILGGLVPNTVREELAAELS